MFARFETLNHRLVTGAFLLLMPLALSRGSELAAGLPPVVKTTQRDFSIPFRIPEREGKEPAVRRVELHVSRDLGVTWQPAGTVPPSARSCGFHAEVDGEYWFRIRSIDEREQIRGGAGPDVRVLVNAAGPRLAARVWRGRDGEVLCRYAAADDTLDLTSLQCEYRTRADGEWKKVAAEAILARQSPAHLIGEEIWWAGEEVEGLTVRIAVADEAGNQTVRQYSLLSSDPQVGQAELARELATLPLPGLATGSAADAVAVAERTGPSPDSNEQRAGLSSGSSSAADPSVSGWPAERGGVWSPSGPRVTATAVASYAEGGEIAASTPAIEQLSGVGVSPPAPSAGSQRPASMEYRGQPLHLVRTRSFNWEYSFRQPSGIETPLRVELWSTIDGGVSWQRAAVDDDTVSPIQVTLPAAGLYGFRIEIVPDLPDAGGGPLPGDQPQTWIGLDDEPPEVSLLGVEPAREASGMSLLIRYRSSDTLPAARSARLAYSPNRSGPWATIAANQENEGVYRWDPDRVVPARVFLRVEVLDAAGNRGYAESAEPVTVAVARVSGTLGRPQVADDVGQ
jgi:hypothetical protein